MEPTSGNQHAEDPNPCSQANSAGLHAALDRMLTSAEGAQEQVQAMRTRLDIYLMVHLLVVSYVLISAYGLYSSFQTVEAKPSPELTTLGAILVLLRVFGMLAPGLVFVVFAERFKNRVQAAYERDSAYVKKVADVLREAVKPDVFPTRLEWHLFQIRLARFEIGRGSEGKSTADNREQEERYAEAIRYMQGKKEIRV